MRRIAFFSLILLLVLSSSAFSGTENVESLILDLKSADPELRRTSLVQLGELGPDALPGAELIVQALSDEVYEVSYAASNALEKIGSGVLPYLEALLVEGTGTVRARQAAARLIGRLGSSEQIAALIAAIDDGAAEVRIQALGSLGRLVDEENAAEIIPVLCQVVAEDFNSGVRKAAVDLLNEIGILSEDVLSALAVAFDDLQLEVTLAANRALRRNQAAIMELAQTMLKSDHPEYQWAAAVLIGRVPQQIPEALPDLVAIVVNPENGMKARWAALAVTASQTPNLNQLNSDSDAEALFQWLQTQISSEEQNLMVFKDAAKQLIKERIESQGLPTLEHPGEWELVFFDDFDGDRLDMTKWSYNYPWGTGHTHNHRAYMLPENVIVSDGILTIKAENERHPDAPLFVEHDGVQYLDYTSGVITSHGKFHFTYGYIEAAIKVPGTPGFWPAFWLLGDGWPPEVDIMEILTRNPRELHINYHYGPSWNNKWSHYQKFTVDDLSQDFFVYGFEWTPTYMRWYLNGEQIGTAFTNQEWIAQSRNLYIILNLAVGGWGGDPNESTVWPGLMEVDWVRVWQRI